MTGAAEGKKVSGNMVGYASFFFVISVVSISYGVRRRVAGGGDVSSSQGYRYHIVRTGQCL
jgi:hypothetical protein